MRGQRFRAARASGWIGSGAVVLGARFESPYVVCDECCPAFVFDTKETENEGNWDGEWRMGEIMQCRMGSPPPHVGGYERAGASAAPLKRKVRDSTELAPPDEIRRPAQGGPGRSRGVILSRGREGNEGDWDGES
jgi:hypothetical protein